MRSHRQLPGIAVALMSAAPAFAITPHQETARLEFPLAFDVHREIVAGRPFAPVPGGRGPVLAVDAKAKLDPLTGWAHLVRGSGETLGAPVRDEATAGSLARRFLLDRGSALGVRADNLVDTRVRRWNGRWSVRFGQAVQGVRVWSATAFVLFDDAGRVAAFGSGFLPEPDGPLPAPALSADEALATAAAALGTTPRADRPASALLFRVPVPEGETFALVSAWRTSFECDEPFGKWESFVHAGTGEVLSRRNLFFPVNVLGHTEGSTAADPPSYGWCSGFSQHPYEHMTVRVDGGSAALTDPAGDFSIPHVGSDPVTVTAGFSGPFADVDRFAGLGADASQTVPAVPGVPFTIDWSDANSRPDERTTFYHANRVHDFVKAIDPSFVELDYNMPSIVGRTDGFCPGNAWWDGFGMNYCAPGTNGNVTLYNTG